MIREPNALDTGGARGREHRLDHRIETHLIDQGEDELGRAGRHRIDVPEERGVDAHRLGEMIRRENEQLGKRPTGAYTTADLGPR